VNQGKTMARPPAAHQWNGPQPAPRALWNLVNANFPQTRFDGIYNPRNIAGTNTPSLHAEGRALDIGLSINVPIEKTIGDQLFDMFIDLAGDMGLQEIIWNREIWSIQRPVKHPYTGHDPHTGHIHVGFTRDASQTTLMPNSLVVRIGVLRTGLEDLDRMMRNVG
jgi:hypothetical protein